MRPTAVHHLAVQVADLARAEAFYVGVLGLPVRRRFDDAHGAARSIWVELGDVFLAIERAAGARRNDDELGWHCVALSIDIRDRERWRAHLGANGHPVERESDFTLYARDPDGALIALSHYPERAE